MMFLYIALGWYISGLILSVLTQIFFDKGVDFDITSLFETILHSIFGPLLIVFILIRINDNYGSKVLIKRSK